MAAISTRVPAARFFEESTVAASETGSTNERVIELLNQTSLLQRDTQRISNLKLIQELIIHKDASLLDSFLAEMIAFQNDRSQDVRKFVVAFLEEACKRDPVTLSKVVGNLSIMLDDKEHVLVVKRVILAMAQLYRVALQWISKCKTAVDESMKNTWTAVQQMKNTIMEMIDSENDGIRTHTVKFLENAVIALSRKSPDSDLPKRLEDDFSLDLVSEKHPLLNVKKLEEEGNKAFDVLLEFQASPHISSVNLMTCLGATTVIARQRPQLMTRVVQAFEALHVNLPPTLAKSQVSSVRKNLKMQMLALLRHASSALHHSQITTLLTDLGATQNEVMKNMPKIEPEAKKRRTTEMRPPTKKQKVEEPIIIPLKDEDEDYGMTPFVSLGSSKGKGKGIGASSKSETSKQSAIDITAEDLTPRLNTQNVADLVLLSMVMLPETMPPQFQATYTPIAAAGTEAQIKHLSRLLATQLTAAGLGKGIHEVQMNEKNEEAEEEEETENEKPDLNKKHTIQTVISGNIPEEEDKDEGEDKFVVPTLLPQPRKLIRAYKLGSVTPTFSQSQKRKLGVEALMRVLDCEEVATRGSASDTRVQLISRMVTISNTEEHRTALESYIMSDVRNRADIALSWLYNEYANYQGYNMASDAGQRSSSLTGYDNTLKRILQSLLLKPDQKEGLFSRILLEAPSITPNAIGILKHYCQEKERIYFGMMTLRDLIIKRPCMRSEFLSVLLEFTSHEVPEVRNNALRVTKRLYERTELVKTIESTALNSLEFLLQKQPPVQLFGLNLGRLTPATAWAEDTIKACLYLYLSLLPLKHSLVHELAKVYTGTVADIKRVILRILEPPVKGMGMNSPELLLLVETCPKGSETLVTRIIHILTDKVAPSPELVARVRDLYQKRVSDVRFLIPVLNGLTKKEVISALPRLIKLNPVVVKEVFNRLLNTQGGTENVYSPLSPADLLVALHNIDTQKCDMKTIIKATNLCFNEREIYSQEMVAVVMQQLMEQDPIPTLLMRTVMQSLAMYPKLIGFVMNIMQRLIIKQVWLEKKVWEGFVKCCQRTKPQSFQVLIQLPVEQLKEVFVIAPDLHEPLLAHIRSFTSHQLAHVPKAVVEYLESDPGEEKHSKEAAEREKISEQDKIYKEKLDKAREEYRRSNNPPPPGEEESEQPSKLFQVTFKPLAPLPVSDSHHAEQDDADITSNRSEADSNHRDVDRNSSQEDSDSQQNVADTKSKAVKSKPTKSKSKVKITATTATRQTRPRK